MVVLIHNMIQMGDVYLYTSIPSSTITICVEEIEDILQTVERGNVFMKPGVLVSDDVCVFHALML